MSGAPASVDPDRPPKGWAPDVWRLRCGLLVARERLPWDTAEARLLDGLERYVRLDGRVPGRRPGTPWWADVLALVSAAAVLCGPETRLLLAPWTGLSRAPHATAGSGFRPVGS